MNTLKVRGLVHRALSGIALPNDRSISNRTLITLSYKNTQNVRRFFKLNL